MFGDSKREGGKRRKVDPKSDAKSQTGTAGPVPHHHVTHPSAVKKKSKKHKKPSGQTQAGGGAAKAAAAAAASQAHKQPSTAGRQAQQTRIAASGHASQSTKQGRRRGAPSMLAKMREKLQGGHFRWLNEQLYTTEGSEALDLMRKEPGLYQQYHDGFRRQTESWPQQPVDVAIEWLASKPASWQVADLGCGDARVAAAAEQHVKSFDLVAAAPGVVACNMAHLPLPAASVDAALFCLSLMGTDYSSFIRESARVLRPAGWLWVAEVQSRFMDEQGRSVLEAFIVAVTSLGFVLKRKDTKNPYFLVLEFQGHKGRQVGGHGAAAEWPSLRACQYKKR